MHFTSRYYSYFSIISFYLLAVITGVIIDDNLEHTNDPAPPEYQPLLLIHHFERKNEKFSIALPELDNDAVYIDTTSGSELWIMCPKPVPQQLEPLRDIIGTGIARNQLNLSSWQISHVKCHEKISHSVQITKINCGLQKMGTIFKLGFLVYHGVMEETSSSSSISASFLKMKMWKKKKKRKHVEFVPLYAACFDTKNQNAIYTQHTIYGSVSEAKEMIDSSIGLRRSEEVYPQNFNFIGDMPDDLYNESTQYENFWNIFNQGGVPHVNLISYHDKMSKFLVKLQLTPADDMVFDSWKTTTFSYLNITPQWESINGRTWRVIEETVRDIAFKKKLDLLVTTGTYKYLSLIRENLYIYLKSSESRVRVSNYIWKIVYESNSKEAIVFIVSNDPYQSTCNIDLCENVCTEAGFSDLYSYKPWSGCVICCNYEEAKTKIKELPSNLIVTALFTK